jgi:two-component system, chemotaxis family, chemotaxis protein CheY
MRLKYDKKGNDLAGKQTPNVSGMAKKLPKVLIVDDVAVARDLMRAMLRSLGVKQIFDASNGIDAIALFRREHPDIVFLDIRMPGMDGLQALGEMLAENPAAFIVIDSAESTAKNVRAALELGAKGFIVKPFNMQKVQGVLDNYFRYKSSPEDTEVDGE